MSPFVTHDARCGLCGFTFEAFMPRNRSITLKWRDTDNCPHYDGPNPVFYAIWVCPSCHYAAYREDFGTTPGKWRDAVHEALAAGAPSAQAVAFDSGERGLFAALTSYQLAMTCYEARRSPPEVLAGLALRAGWICRYAAELRREIGFLAKARDRYLDSFEKGCKQSDDLPVAYLAAELLMRTGRVAEAAPYFRLVREARDTAPALVAMAQEREDDARKAVKTKGWIGTIPLFAPLGDRGLSLLAVYARERTFKPGVPVIAKGNPGEAMYVVMNGKVRIFGSEPGAPIAVLGQGETFGEMALFTGEHHRETVVAWEPQRGRDLVTLLAIDRVVFRNLVKAVPDVALRVAVAMSQRYQRFASGVEGAPAETLLADPIV